MCAVSVTLRLEGYQDVITESTATYSLTVPSKFIDTNSYLILLYNIFVKYK